MRFEALILVAGLVLGVGAAQAHQLPEYAHEIKTLTPEQAQALAERGGDLYFDGLTTLSDKAAQALAEHKDWLSLNGLTKLTCVDLTTKPTQHKSTALPRANSTSVSGSWRMICSALCFFCCGICCPPLVAPRRDSLSLKVVTFKGVRSLLNIGEQQMISNNLRRLLIGLIFFLPSQGAIAQVAQLGPAPAQVRTLLTIDLAKICDRDVGFQCQMNKWISEPKRLTKNAERSADLAAGHDYFTFRVEVDRKEIGNHLAATVGPTENTLFLCCDRSTADYVINNLSKNERYSQDAQIIMHVRKIKKDSGAVLYVGWVRKLVLNKNPGDALFDSAFPGVRDRYR